MERVSLIKRGLSGIGTQAGVYYTNQEIVDRLKNFQSALTQGVYEKTHAENFSEREIIKHFEMLVTDYGLETSERFLRLRNNLNVLGRTIGTYIKGMMGERESRKALKLVSLDKGVEILYNICMDDGECKTEYDAIVVTPYGLFVIEVKNWEGASTITEKGLLVHETGRVYDLVGKMNAKEVLLKECLGDMFPKRYVSMLLVSDEKAKIVDEYHRMPYFVGGGISSDIRLYSKQGNILSDKQINKLVALIKDKHIEQKTKSPVNCEQIIDDYAHLMAEIEERAKSMNSEEKDDTDNPFAGVGFVESGLPKSWWERINWKIVGKSALGLGAGVATVLALSKGAKHYLRG